MKTQCDQDIFRPAHFNDDISGFLPELPPINPALPANEIKRKQRELANQLIIKPKTPGIFLEKGISHFVPNLRFVKELREALENKRLIPIEQTAEELCTAELWPGVIHAEKYIVNEDQLRHRFHTGGFDQPMFEKTDYGYRFFLSTDGVPVAQIFERAIMAEPHLDGIFSKSRGTMFSLKSLPKKTTLY